mmetsp:Transcript_21229/g.49001  ORF Transcript_21229/g.49001 Transcript_21229/m.49001 type:complete len:202 (+) Transcript_21229:136-741(+)
MSATKTKTAGPQLCLQLLVSPMLQWGALTPSMIRYRHTPALSFVQLTHAWQLYLQNPATDAQLHRASPGLLSNRGLEQLGRVHIIGAEVDVLRDEGEAFVDRLREKGRNATYTMYPGVPHGFFGDSRYAGGAEALVEAAAVVREACPAGRRGSQEASAAAEAVRSGTRSLKAREEKRDVFKQGVRSQLSDGRTAEASSMDK